MVHIEKVMKGKFKILIIILIILSQNSFCQNRKDTITASTLNKQILMLLDKNKLFKNLINKDYQGDSAIFIDVTNYKQFYQQKPFQNDGFKTYYWNPEEMFFYSIGMPYLRIIYYAHSWYSTNCEFITRSFEKGYYVNVEFLHYDLGNKSKIPTVINKLEISKIKTIWKDENAP